MRPLGKLLLSKILKTGDLKSALDLKFDPNYHLFDPEDRAIFDFILEHFYGRDTFGEVPSSDLVQEIFPTFKMDVPSDSVASLCVQLRKYYIGRALDEMVADLAELNDADPEEALGLAKERLSLISAQSSSSAEDLDIATSGQAFIDEQELLAEYNGLLPGGVGFPWESFNLELGGMNPSEFIIFYGRPASMKSWISIVCAVHAYMNYNSTVLFYSREMGPPLIRRRALACMLKKDYRRFKKWQSMDPATKLQVKDFVTTMQGDEVAISRFTGTQRKRFIITSDYIDRDGGTVESLKMKIAEYRPNLVVVDGVYLMNTPSSGKKGRKKDWADIYAITQELKATAQIFNIPIIGTNQAKQSAAGGKGGTEEQSYGDSFNQDCDVLCRIMKLKEKLVLTLPKVREADELIGIEINRKAAYDFQEIRRLESWEEVEAADKEDKQRVKNEEERRKAQMTSRLGKSPFGT